MTSTAKKSAEIDLTRLTRLAAVSFDLRNLLTMYMKSHLTQRSFEVLPQSHLGNEEGGVPMTEGAQWFFRFVANVAGPRSSMARLSGLLR